MKLTRKLGKSTTLTRKQLEPGPKEDKSSINVSKMPQERHGSMTSTQLVNFSNLIQKKLFEKNQPVGRMLFELYMSESHQLVTRETYKDNANYFSALIQILKLYQTLDPDSTFINLGYPPWLEEFVAIKSHKWSLPIAIESADSDMSSLNKFVKSMDVASWFTVMESTTTMRPMIQNSNLRKISCPLLMSSWQATTGKEPPNSKRNAKGSKKSKKEDQKEEIPKEKKKKEGKPKATGILKVRLYPTRDQKKKLDKMFEANRYAWNILVEKIDTNLFTSTPKQLDAGYRKYVKKSNIDKDLSIYPCNEECFDSAYRDIIKARETTIKLSVSQKQRTGKGFVFPERLKFKSKKNKSGNSIEIRARNLTYDPKKRTIEFHPTYFKNTPIRMKTDLQKLGFTNFQYSCRLNMVADHYYLNVPYIRVVNPTNSGKVCAIDPGVRTFLTGYDPSGYAFEICSDNKHIRKKKRRIEELQIDLEFAPNKKKRDRIKQEIKNIYKKITNCVNDLHHKASRILADTYDEILLPSFNTQDMVRKDGKKKRVISPDTAYNMLTLSHYKFQKLLDHKMKIRQGKLHVCTEGYTTKTCGHCGRLNHDVGSKSVFKCPHEGCGYVGDRDMNAARNIFIMNHKLISTKYIE